nr:hypothetical protein [uncultured Mucilaginibacter sp.]
MNQRLSIKYNLFQKVVFAIFIWFVLSLPTPVGLFEYLLIKTNYDFLNIAQRVIHFFICLLASFYFYKDRIVLAYNDTDLVVTDTKKQETYSIPFTAFTGIKLKPTFVRTAGKTSTYELTFKTKQTTEESLTFKAYPGKKLSRFIEVLKAANPQIEEKYWAFY